MKDDTFTTVGKIEFDESTAEPKIVEVDIKDVPKDKDVTIENAVDKPKKSSGRQLSMQNLFLPNENETVDKRQKLLKRILSAVFIAIVIAALAYTAINDFGSGKEMASAEEIFATLFANWFYLPCAFTALFLAFFCKGLKLSFCAKHLTGKWHFKVCMETAIVGHYYNYVTPLAVGGQPFEIFYLSKHGVHGGVASSLPIATYFSTQFAVTLLGIVAIVFLRFDVLNLDPEFFPKAALNMTTGVAIIGLVLGFLMPIMVVLFCILPRLAASIFYAGVWIGHKIRLVKDPKRTMYRSLRTIINNSRCLKKITRNPLVFIASLIMGFGEQLALLSIAYFTLRFFGFDMPTDGFTEWMQMIQVCAILQAAVSFIPTPGNSGAQELSFYFLFETGLHRGGFTFPAMLTWRLISYYMVLLIGFSFLTSKKHAEKKSLQKFK